MMAADRPRGLGAADLLTTDEAARYLRCSREAVIALADGADLWLPSPGKGGTRLLQVAALLEALRRPAPTPDPLPAPATPRSPIRRRRSPTSN